MSYGKIYETTWWGTTSNNIGFGGVYSDLSAPAQAGFETSVFKTRVQNDSGTWEAELCLNNEITRIEAI